MPTLIAMKERQDKHVCTRFNLLYTWYILGRFGRKNTQTCPNNKQYISYNWERIFFILSFFVGYISSFGLVRLRTIRLSARVGAHIERRCSCSCGEEVTITDVIIKTLDRKWDWGMWMTSCLEVMGWDSWVFWKKAVSWDLDLDESSCLLRGARALVVSVSRELTLDEQSA